MEAIRSPKIGYSSDEKQKYRELVWDAILSQPRNSNGKVLILPSKDGEEIDYLIQRGLRQKDLICIDENPALIASAPWRKKYKSIKVYGCKVSKVADRLKKDGLFLSCANLDLCNNFSEELISEVSSFLQHAPICEKDFTFSVTVSKGREQSVTNYLMNLLMQENSWQASDYTKMNEKRIACLMRICSKLVPNSKFIKLITEGSYIHHKTPMAFAVFSIVDKIKSHSCEHIFEMVNFEVGLYKRCNIEHVVNRLWNANRSYYNVICNLDTISAICNHDDGLHEVLNDIKNGKYDKCATIARLLLEEHQKIEKEVTKFHMGAMDLDRRQGLCEYLWRTGIRDSNVDLIYQSLNVFDAIKSKAP